MFGYDDLVNIHILSSSANHIDAKIIPNDTTPMWCFMVYYATLSLIHVHILGPFCIGLALYTISLGFMVEEREGGRVGRGGIHEILFHEEKNGGHRRPNA